MTNEDNTTDVPFSNWTLATGTKPGVRYVVLADYQKDCPVCCAGNEVVAGAVRREHDAESSRVMQMEDSMNARCLAVAMVLTATAVIGAEGLDFDSRLARIVVDGHRRAMAHAQVNVVEPGLAR